MFLQPRGKNTESGKFQRGKWTMDDPGGTGTGHQEVCSFQHTKDRLKINGPHNNTIERVLVREENLQVNGGHSRTKTGGSSRKSINKTYKGGSKISTINVFPPGYPR